MDESAVPGDDFFAYADGTWVKNTEIPEDRSRIGGFYHRRQGARAADARDARCDSEGRCRPAATRRRSPTTTGPISNTDAIDRAGVAPAKADIDAIDAIADKRQLSAAIGGDVRADTDPLNATNYPDRKSVRRLRHPGTERAGRAMPYLMQGGIGLPGARVLPVRATRTWRNCAIKYQRLRPQILQTANYPDPAGATETHPGPGDEDRARARDARRARTSPRARRSGPRRNSSEGARASIGRRCSTRRSLAARRSSTPITSRRFRSSRRSSARSRSRTGRTGWRSTH